MNDPKKRANSNNPLQFYKRNPFKNESDQKKKVHQKKLKSPSNLQKKSL